MARTCAVGGCSKATYVRGWCTLHYQRWRRHGDPRVTMQPSTGMDLEQRLWSQVNRGAGSSCWQWTGALTPDGYGHFRKAGNEFLTHRLAYELLVGPIPEGLVLDHLCRNRACCNPTHLEPVTHAENIRRGQSPSAYNARKLLCINDHVLDGDNLYVPPRGGRTCRTCQRERHRKWRAAQC